MSVVFAVLILCFVTREVVQDRIKLSDSSTKDQYGENEFDSRLTEKIENMFAKEKTEIITKWESEKAEMVSKWELEKNEMVTKWEKEIAGCFTNRESEKADILKKWKNEKAEMQKQISLLQQRVDQVQLNPKKRLLLGVNSTAQGSTHSSRVAFYVNHAKPNKYLGIRQTIRFGSVVTNLGNCYHSSSGIFVCNISGYYMFTVNILLDPGSALGFYLEKNGVTVIHFLCDVNSQYGNCGGSVILHVIAGDTVQVLTDRALNNQGITWESGFSGFLIYED